MSKFLAVFCLSAACLSASAVEYRRVDDYKAEIIKYLIPADEKNVEASCYLEVTPIFDITLPPNVKFRNEFRPDQSQNCLMSFRNSEAESTPEARAAIKTYKSGQKLRLTQINTISGDWWTSKLVDSQYSVLMKGDDFSLRCFKRFDHFEHRNDERAISLIEIVMTLQSVADVSLYCPVR